MLYGVGHLCLDTKIDFDQEKLYQCIGKRLALLKSRFEHDVPHQHRIVLNEGNQRVRACNSDGRVGVLERILDDIEKAVVDEILVHVLAGLAIQALRSGAKLLNDHDGVLFALQAGLGGAEDAKQFLHVRRVVLQPLCYIHLMVEDERVEDAKGRIVEDTRQHDVFEILQPICIVNALPDAGVLNLDHFLEPRFVGQELAMLGFVQRKIRVVYVR